MEITTTSMMDYEKGGDGFDYKQAEILRKAMEECDLVDLGYMGYEYTWSNGRSGTDNIQERLDRFLANKLWRGTFPGSFVNHLPKRKFDHLPIILNIRGPRNRVKEKNKVKLFRFEEMWLKELSCEDIVKQSWNINADCRTKLNATTLNLKAWSRETFGNGTKELKDCRNKMEELMEEDQTEETLAKMRALDAKMDELEHREELYWKQQSRKLWLKDGDKNTRFFHAKANQRRDRNTILSIRDETGIIVDKEEDITETMVNFFDNLIWEDPWIPTRPGFKAPEGCLENVNNLTWVSDLLEEDGWNHERVTTVFPNEVAREILKIQVPVYPQRDSWTWLYSKDGFYSVRSAYYIQLQGTYCIPSTSNNSSSNLWNRIWRTKVPTKIKNFAWRSCKNGIPVKVNLVKRSACVDSRCQLCGEDNETTEHILLHCSEARKVWYLSPLRLSSGEHQDVSLKDKCLHLMTIYKEERWWELFWTIAWSIWTNRNAWCFEKKKKEGMELVQRATNLVNDPVRWTPPVEGTYKLNTDVAVFQEGKVGLGAILRDHMGETVVTTCWMVAGDYKVELGEGLAARHGLKIALEAGFEHIILETDSVKLYTHVKKENEENNTFGRIVQDIKTLAGRCLTFEVLHVKRGANKAAYHLAKLSQKFAEMRVWLEENPSEIAHV
ncbi:hypothetical protein RDABS01_000184, partial [Bienertia sinuspersici]